MPIPRPDYIQGYVKESFGFDDLLEAVEPWADPEEVDRPITLSHLVGEIRTPGGDIVFGSLELAYDAACPVYGRQQANTLLESVDEPNTAHVAGFITDGLRFQISVHYSAPDRHG